MQTKLFPKCGILKNEKEKEGVYQYKYVKFETEFPKEEKPKKTVRQGPIEA